MEPALTSYLIIHGIATVGSVVVFLIRNEHRITKLETTLALLKEQHDRYTSPTLDLHRTNP